ncbi:hypothetical protein BCR43DRAFT_482265 [Syncephalastrum racemosum]|uniref:Uncharacterized protein n=1 Tax=Syncephalastrum racemosum TaxID=13706 RepID=A0A1X2HTM9_SYNRA|nr:hypothetical protein BCR43DRAFT_482265 [Syncephalastrum racemosum]
MARRDNIRFSLASCNTDDSADSSSLATPLDASPSASHSTFPIITVIADDAYPNRSNIPSVAATVIPHHNHQRRPPPYNATTLRRTSHLQNHTLPSPASSPRQQVQPHHEQDQDQDQPGLWPRLKRMVSSSSLARIGSSSSTSTTNTTLDEEPMKSSFDPMQGLSDKLQEFCVDKTKTQYKKKRRWFEKARIQPQ